MAACDLLLMPSRYEPCGLPQMYSQMFWPQSRFHTIRQDFQHFETSKLTSSIQVRISSAYGMEAVNFSRKVWNSASGSRNRRIGRLCQGLQTPPFPQPFVTWWRLNQIQKQKYVSKVVNQTDAKRNDMLWQYATKQFHEVVVENLLGHLFGSWNSHRLSCPIAQSCHAVTHWKIRIVSEYSGVVPRCSKHPEKSQMVSQVLPAWCMSSTSKVSPLSSDKLKDTWMILQYFLVISLFRCISIRDFTKLIWVELGGNLIPSSGVEFEEKRRFPSYATYCDVGSLRDSECQAWWLAVAHCCKDVPRQHDYYWPKAMDEYALTSVVCLKNWPSDVSGMKESDLVSWVYRGFTEERQIDIVLYECATVR